MEDVKFSAPFQLRNVMKRIALPTQEAWRGANDSIPMPRMRHHHYLETLRLLPIEHPSAFHGARPRYVQRFLCGDTFVRAAQVCKGSCRGWFCSAGCQEKERSIKTRRRVQRFGSTSWMRYMECPALNLQCYKLYFHCLRSMGTSASK